MEVDGELEGNDQENIINEEELEDDDEEEAEDNSDESSDGYPSLQQLDYAETLKDLAALEQNLEAKKHVTLYIFDDDIAIRAGKALMGNTHLVHLYIFLHYPITASEAEGLIQGLRHSQVNHLELAECEDENDQSLDLFSKPDFLGFLGESIASLKELTLKSNLTNALANRLGEKLVGNTTLKTLYCAVGGSALNNYVDAQTMAKGLVRSKLEKLTLQQWGHATDRRVLHAIFEGLASVRELELDFDLNVADAAALGDALMGNTSITTLSIKLPCDATFFDSEFETVQGNGAVRLANGLRLSKIESLSLEANRGSTTVQATLFEQGLQESQTIRHLLIRISDGALATTALSACLHRLSTLTINGSCARQNGFMAGLRAASRLTSLNVTNDELNPQVTAALCEAIPYLTCLESLAVRCNLLCEEGLAWYDEPRAHNVVWQYSDFEARNIRPIGAERLMIAVANHPSITQLSLEFCLDLGFMGLEMIGQQLPHVKLQKLVLWGLDDHFQRKGKDEDIARALHRASEGLLAGVRSNLFLRELRVEHTNIAEHVMKQIDFYLDLNKSGRYLLHADHGVPPGVWCLVLAKCRDKIDALYYFLRENPMLLAAAGAISKRVAGAKRHRDQSSCAAF